MPSMVILGIFLIFALILVRLFLFAFIEVGINLSIMYFIFLHLRAEIKKRKRTEAYVIGMLGSLIVILLLGNLIALWRITTVTIVTLLFGKLYIAATRP